MKLCVSQALSSIYQNENHFVIDFNETYSLTFNSNLNKTLNLKLSFWKMKM